MARRKVPAQSKTPKPPGSDWNSWQPGSGRKGYAPPGFANEAERPPVRDQNGRPLLGDGSGRVDWARYDREINGEE